MKNVFQRYWRTGAAILIVAGLLLLALSGYLAPVISVVMNPVVGAQSWLATRYLAIYELISSPGDVTALRLDNERLRTENALLRSQVIQMQEQQNDFESLYALLRVARTRPDSDYLAAMVIGRDPSPFLRYIFINQGSDAGLKRGMPVVTDQGLVGRVDAVISNAARVQLITDPSSAVNVRLEETERDVVLVGSVSGDLSLDLVAQDLALEPGNLLLTSGLGGSYPPDLIVGQILNVRKRDSDIFQQASVQPVVDFASLKIVLIVTDFRPVDISPLIPVP
jgi:rod shape-determining protein MreC